MKKTSLIICIFLGLIITSCNQPNKQEQQEPTNPTISSSNNIVFFNLDQVLKEYDMAKELRANVEAKIKGIQEEIERRGNKLQKEFEDFNDKLSKGLLTQSVAEAQGQKLQEKKYKFDAYAAEKQQEIMQEQQVLTNQLANAIKTFVDKYNKVKSYSLILSTQGEILPLPICAADSSLDITKDIIQKINEDYKNLKK